MAMKSLSATAFNRLPLLSSSGARPPTSSKVTDSRAPPASPTLYTLRDYASKHFIVTGQGARSAVHPSLWSHTKVGGISFSPQTQTLSAPVPSLRRRPSGCPDGHRSGGDEGLGSRLIFIFCQTLHLFSILIEMKWNTILQVQMTLHVNVAIQSVLYDHHKLFEKKEHGMFILCFSLLYSGWAEKAVVGWLARRSSAFRPGSQDVHWYTAANLCNVFFFKTGTK